MMAFIVTRSTMPLKSPSAPIGSWIGIALPAPSVLPSAPRRSFMVWTEPSKSAPMRSILLM